MERLFERREIRTEREFILLRTGGVMLVPSVSKILIYGHGRNRGVIRGEIF